jgi:hypothetical protein
MRGTTHHIYATSGRIPVPWRKAKPGMNLMGGERAFTENHRCAFIVNYRPAAMIAHERNHGFDHGRTNNDRGIRNEDART